MAPHAVLLLIWGFHKMGHPQNSWFLMENSMNMDDLGLPPFMETPIFWKSVCSFSSSHFQPGMTRSVTIWSRCTNEDGSMAICSPKTCSSMIRSWDSTSGGWIYIYNYIYIFKVPDILVPTTGLANVLPRKSDGDICLCRGLLRIFTKMGTVCTWNFHYFWTTP